MQRLLTKSNGAPAQGALRSPTARILAGLDRDRLGLRLGIIHSDDVAADVDRIGRGRRLRGESSRCQRYAKEGDLVKTAECDAAYS